MQREDEMAMLNTHCERGEKHAKPRSTCTVRVRIARR